MENKNNVTLREMVQELNGKKVDICTSGKSTLSDVFLENVELKYAERYLDEQILSDNVARDVDDVDDDYEATVSYLYICMANGDLFIPVYDDGFDNSELTWEDLFGEDSSFDGIYVTGIYRWGHDKLAYLVTFSGDVPSVIIIEREANEKHKLSDKLSSNEYLCQA